MDATCSNAMCGRVVAKGERYCSLHGGLSQAERDRIEATTRRGEPLPGGFRQVEGPRRRRDPQTIAIVAVTFAGIVAVGAFIVSQVQDHSGQGRPSENTQGECASAAPAFASWLTRQSSVYGEDLNSRYGIQSVRADCGDVTVETLIAEDVTGYGLAESACNLLSSAVGQATGVESVTVRYGTGKNACYEWPGGTSHFG